MHPSICTLKAGEDFHLRHPRDSKANLSKWFLPLPGSPLRSDLAESPTSRKFLPAWITPSAPAPPPPRSPGIFENGRCRLQLRSRRNRTSPMRLPNLTIMKMLAITRCRFTSQAPQSGPRRKKRSCRTEMVTKNLLRLRDLNFGRNFVSAERTFGSGTSARRLKQSPRVVRPDTCSEVRVTMSNRRWIKNKISVHSS